MGSPVSRSIAGRPREIQGPADHARALHPAGPGLVTLARRTTDGHWLEARYPVSVLPKRAAELGGLPDVFLTQNRFRGPRRITYLTALDALWVDLDYQRTVWAERSPAVMLDAALEILGDAGLPAPSFSVATGRGLALVWLHDPVPRAALPRWRACQRHLYTVLAPLGADRAALDPARVLRVVGTRNAKVGRLVEALTPVGPAWSFDDLADAILPLTRAALQALRIQRALRHAGSGAQPARPPQGFTQATLWEARLSDLQRLLELRWWGRLPPGQRDTWLFLAGVAMSWLAEPFLLRRELFALAHQVGGWDEREAQTRLQAVLQRAQAAAQGHTVVWEGKPIDPRYRFRTTTILEWLAITPEEQRHLQTLISPEEARRRHREAEQARTRRIGAVQQDRATYLAAAAARREEARQRRARGESLRQIARALGVSPEAVRKMLQGPPPATGNS